jgi:phosphoribosylaminoimidazolecarboxamide formyltransferase/IMP cyclohydrolase
MKRINSALISVFYKDGLEAIVRRLAASGVEIYSTGGTLEFINGLGIAARSVEGLTGYPSILGGRVKTLHPNVFGGILARRNNTGDVAQMEEYKIPEIDLVIVDLYPFEQTVASGAAEAEVIEKIDIGGISLIRAAAKNFKDVVIVPSVAQYGELLQLLESQDCQTTLEQRRALAGKAFGVSSGYDTAIFNYFNGSTVLRYGENPHQAATFHGDLGAMFEKLHGKDISYNNMLDIDAAVNLIAEFSEPTFAILKHNNACGAATREVLVDAWKAALECDPVSAFGGVLVTNRPVDEATAAEIDKLFFEVIIAPGYAPSALATLQSKKNRIILVLKEGTPSAKVRRTLLNGVAEMERDTKLGGRDTELTVVTKKGITAEQEKELLFANILVKHSKSNAIVLTHGLQLLGSGVGQTSRVDALKQAIAKAKSFGFELKGAALASDAFFPFADSVEIAHGEGIDTIIQPGGSVRDNDSIEYCDAHGMAMAFTGMRHFRH